MDTIIVKYLTSGQPSLQIPFGSLLKKAKKFTTMIRLYLKNWLRVERKSEYCIINE